MVQVKIKDHSRMAFVLAAGSFHSFNRSPLRSYLTTQLTISFVHLTSFSTARVSGSLPTRSNPHPQNSIQQAAAFAFTNFADFAAFAN
jgi:hypothetical protein